LKSLHILHSESATGWGGQEIRVFQESELLLERAIESLWFANQKAIYGKKALPLPHQISNATPY